MGGKVLLSPLIPSSPSASSVLQLRLFVYRNNGESWHHDCKMFQFSFLQAFTSFFVCALYVCVQLKDPLSQWAQNIEELTNEKGFFFFLLVSKGVNPKQIDRVVYNFPSSQAERGILSWYTYKAVLAPVKDRNSLERVCVCLRGHVLVCDFVFCVWEHLLE